MAFSMQLFAIQKHSSNIFFSIMEENKVTHKIFEYIHQPPVTMHLFKSPAQVHINLIHPVQLMGEL